MPAITIQQAYAIQYQGYIDLTNPTLTGKLTCSTGLTATNKSRLAQLLDNNQKDLGTIAVTNKTGTTTTLIAAADTPSSTTYTLVTTSTNTNGGLLDYLEGGQIDSTSGTLSTVEANIHKTGKAIFNKIKK
jgi:hypothetical protein